MTVGAADVGDDLEVAFGAAVSMPVGVDVCGVDVGSAEDTVVVFPDVS